MRVSQALIPTVKETPGEAEIPSHKLMLRAGLMRKVASGIYEYLPLGFRSILKVANIIREEMARAGAQEVLLPIMTPAELWQETGRWQKYGKELMRVKDRHERDFALGPTHEEVITDLVRRELKSYKQLPQNLFQIATKFRDEVSPRFGVMRSREFLMKDGYSFDVDDAASDITYWKMYEAYKRIFKRCGLEFSPVEADSGLIGGSFHPRVHGLGRERGSRHRLVPGLFLFGQHGKSRRESLRPAPVSQATSEAAVAGGYPRQIHGGRCGGPVETSPRPIHQDPHFHRRRQTRGGAGARGPRRQ